MKVLDGKINRIKKHYKVLMNYNRDRKKVNVRTRKKSEMTTHVEYIFITFKNCTTSETVLNAFKKEQNIVRCINLCCAKRQPSEIRRVLRTGGYNEQEIDIVEPVEPDDIIWENLAYSKSQ